jgi:membrane protease YdiL (CAAX protease family)
MNPSDQISPPGWLQAAVVAASAAIWGVVLLRWWLGRPVIRYQPRRPVPWDGGHVLLMFFLYILLSGTALFAIRAALATDAGGGKVEPPSIMHPIEKMLRSGEGNVWVIAAAVLAAVVAAPIAEEFFFRVLLQGWLEAGARRHRRALRLAWRFLPRAGPILLSSLLFGAMHFRLAGAAAPAPPLLFVVAVLTADAVAKLLAMTCVIILLQTQRGATAADFGWAPGKLAGDVGLGLAAFAAIGPSVFLLQYHAQKMADHLFGPERVAANPAPLFLFALVLGTLYYRTHRIAPAIITHAALNATTVALLCWRM